MSVLEGFLDEPPDEEWCQIHNDTRPCQHCADRLSDWTFDEELERRRA